ncbi:MAG: glycosyltransferase family 4 protein [Nitrososphaeraceae archaeon]|nr:glycosyltransferase family 4 protein [Nitrososphaeraceae archaeon]
MAKEIKLVLVTPSYYPQIGGLETHVKEIAERLIKSIPVEVYTLSHNLTKRIEIEEIDGVMVKRFKATTLTDGIRVVSSEFTRELKTCNANVIHLQGFHSLLPYYLSRTRLLHKLIITAHYHGKGHTFLRNILFNCYKPTLKKIARSAERVISVSKYEKSLILKELNVDEDRVIVIPNGVSSDIFDVIHRASSQNFCKILSIGRLEKYKHFDMLIKAMRILDRDFKLTIVGDGPERCNLLGLIDKFGLSDRIFLKSNLSRKDLLEEYISSNLFVLLSYHEAFSIVVAEAQYLGLNTIVPNASALSEFVEGGYAYGVNLPLTPRKVADAIIEISNLPAPLKKYAPWTWDSVAEEHIKLYRSLC